MINSIYLERNILPPIEKTETYSENESTDCNSNVKNILDCSEDQIAVIIDQMKEKIILSDYKNNITVTLSIPGPYQYIDSALLSPDHKTISVSFYDNLELLNVNGEFITKFPDIEIIRFSPDSRYILGYKNRTDLVLIDTLYNYQEKVLVSPYTYFLIPKVVYDPEGQQFVSYGCTNGFEWESGEFCVKDTALLWSKDGDLHASLDGQDRIYSLDVSADGTSIKTTGCERVWEMTRIIPESYCLGQSIRTYDLNAKTTGFVVWNIGKFSVNY
jgi:WD40 repeat protein